jgi:hypothetical protein
MKILGWFKELNGIKKTKSFSNTHALPLSKEKEKKN